MSDGFEALMAEIQSGKQGTPRLLSFDAPADGDLTGVAMGIGYRDSSGTNSRRWVTVRSIDPVYEGTMFAYCWKRRSLRTFRLDRISEVVDGDGQVMDAEDFLAGLGYRKELAAPRWENDKDVFSSQEENAQLISTHSAEGFNTWVAAQNAAETARTGNEKPQHSKPKNSMWIGLGGMAVGIVAATLAITDGPTALFGFLSLIALIGVVVSLIKPKLILPKAENPSRLKALASSLMVLVVVLGTGVAVTPSPEPSAPQVQAAPVQAAIAAASSEETTPLTVEGIGISTSEALKFFADLGFAQEQGVPVNGQEKWVGRSGPAISEVLAVKDEASSMGLMLIFSQDEEQNTTHVLRMTALAKFTVPNWENSLEWMSNAFQAGGDETIVDGRRISLSFTPELGTAAFNIKAAD